MERETMTTEHVRENRTVGDLLRELTRETTTLLRQEVELAKTEMSEKAARAGRNIAYIAIGGLVAYAGLLTLVAFLVMALTAALGTAMSIHNAMWLSALIVGVAVGLVGYAMIRKAPKTLRSESVVPRQTMETMRANKEWLQQEIRQAPA